MNVSVFDAAAVLAACAVFGGIGALLGIGGGVFLVPFLVFALDLPIEQAAGTSLLTVIATSTALASDRAARELTNVRLGLLLMVATLGGTLAAGAAVGLLSSRTLYLLFSAATLGIAGVMLTRLDIRNVILDPAVDVGALGGRFDEAESGCEVAYRVKRLPLALGGSFVSGMLSTILGIGGGIINVPLLNAWCGVPLRAAAATSVFMLGVTAASGAVIHYGRGGIVPILAAAAVIGVRIGTGAGMRFSARTKARWLKLLMAGVLVIVSMLMFTRAR